MSTATTVSNRPYMTRAERQRLIDDYIRRHGSFDNQGFVDEVRTTGPDHPAFAYQHRDLRPMGKVKRILPGLTDLWAEVLFNGEGEAVLASGERPFGVANWYCEHCENDVVFAPFELKSIGLTNMPLHPVREILSGEYLVKELEYQI